MKEIIQKRLVILLIISLSLNLAFGLFFIGKIAIKYEQYKISKQEIKGAVFNRWNSFDMIEFSFNGVNAKFVFPNQKEKLNQQKYWIWRTQFWGEEPQVDIALLKKGFCLVYVNVVDQYGSNNTMVRFNDFYKFMIKNFNLKSKVVLEGMSRGGLDAYNWASENTDKVYCIYADAPVCDLKSWPGGLGKGKGSKEDWNKCLKAYGLTKLTVDNYRNMPIYNCKKIAEAKIPVLHVCGDKDSIVPIDENTYKLAETFRRAGGNIQIIVKKGKGHHPHSLKDPTPIVDFILENTINK